MKCVNTAIRVTVTLLLIFFLTFSTIGSEISNAIDTRSVIFTTSDVEYATSVIQSPDGGFLVTGETYRDPTDSLNAVFLLVKFDANLNIQWSKKIVGLSVGGGVQQTTDGYIITSIRGILKIDFMGKVSWHKRFSRYENIYPGAQQTMDGGYILGSSRAQKNFSLIKFSSKGDLQWWKRYTTPSCFGKYSSAIEQTTNGDFVVLGNNACLTAHQPTGIFLVKVDSDGKPAWERVYDTDLGIQPLGMTNTKGGGYLIAARLYRTPNGGPYRTFFLKVDSKGDIEWYRTYNKPLIIRSLTELHDGSFVMIADRKHLIKLDARGNLLFIKTYTTSLDNYLAGFVVSADGSFITAGAALSKNLVNQHDLWMLKLDGDGNLGNSTCAIIKNKALKIVQDPIVTVHKGITVQFKSVSGKPINPKVKSKDLLFETSSSCD